MTTTGAARAMADRKTATVTSYELELRQVVRSLADQVEAWRAECGRINEALERAGYVIVPREPTEEMLDAADSLRVMRASRSWNDEVWQAMIAAFENEDKAMKGGG